jgi:transcriptional regulator GlxA family with amidase domain
MKHVSLLAIPDALGSTITIPMEMLSAARDIQRARRLQGEQVTIETVAVASKTVRLNGGLNIQCDRAVAELENSDLIFIPGLWGNPRRALQQSAILPPWLAQMHARGSTICAVTTGAFFAAEAGLLDGHSATTHWRYFELFAQRYRQSKLERKRFITNDNRVFCTGSVNAVRDIMLHFVDQLFGEDISNQVARHFTHELSRSYESLLLARDQHSTHHDETIIKVQEWMQENYRANIQLDDIARQFRMSTRSLNRRFKSAANTTPIQYLQEFRLSQAKDLLKHSNLVISEVADQVGYADASYFTALFKKLNAVTPNEYRRLVRNKLFATETGKDF